MMNSGRSDAGKFKPKKSAAARNWDGRTYFAYGSNMDEAQMAYRCPGAELVGKGVLRGFSFELDSAGVGTVVRSRGNVEGLLWRLTDSDIESLDMYEGVSGGCYKKKYLNIETSSGQAAALVYVSNRKRGFGCLRYDYMNGIVAAAIAHGFSDKYVRELSLWLGEEEQLSEHFSRSEFSCGCGCGYSWVHPELIRKLERMREYLCNKPLIIVSGCRCEEYNSSLPHLEDHQEQNCPHCRGMAADISLQGHSSMFDLAFMAVNAEFNGIEIHDAYIHVDIDNGRKTSMEDLEKILIKE